MLKKINTSSFYSLNDNHLPDHLLSKIKSYDDYTYINKQMKEVEEIKAGTRKSYSFDEFEQMMQKEGL